MECDFRSRFGPHHNAQIPTHHAATSSSPATHPMHAPPPLYLKQLGSHGHAAVSPVARPSQYHQTSTPSSSPGLGIRVAIKPEYRITAPPHLSQQAGDIPRSNFQFDFGLERKFLGEADKESPNWSKFGMENLPTKVYESTSPKVSVSDPVVSKYIAMGLSREAVPIAVANYGDNPTKVRDFVNGYILLLEMGFSSSSVTEALFMYDNDTDKALAHFLKGS